MPNVRISGIGIISSAGSTYTDFLNIIQQNHCCVNQITLFPVNCNCEYAGEIGEYEWKSKCFSKQTYADRTTEICVIAMREALDNAGYHIPVSHSDNAIGLCFGTSWGSLNSAEKFFGPLASGKPKTVSSLVFSHSYPNCPASFCAIEFGLRGYSTVFFGDDRAGWWALESAVDAIRSGTSLRMIAGAAESLSPALWSYFESIGKLPNTTTTDDITTFSSSCPGEAAVFFALEATDKDSDDFTFPSESVDFLFGNTGSASPLLALAKRYSISKGVC